MMKSYLDKGNFTTAYPNYKENKKNKYERIKEGELPFSYLHLWPHVTFFYLDQMKGREVTPTEATLEAFISFFALHPNKTNQAKFEATLSSLGLPSRAPTPLHRRRRGWWMYWTTHY